MRDMIRASEKLRLINLPADELILEAAKESIRQGYKLVDHGADALRNIGVFSRISKAIIKFMH